MPLFPHHPSRLQPALLRSLTNPPPPKKSHSAAAPIHLDDSESSSVSRFFSDFSPPTPPVELELELVSLSPKSLSSSPLPVALSALSSSSPSSSCGFASSSQDLSYKERCKLAMYLIGTSKQNAMAVYQWTRQQKVKRGIWAAAFAACIFAGTITGAQLKTDKEKEEAIKEFRATSPNEQIAALQSQRQVLVAQRDVLQRKMDAFQERVKEREAERAKKEGTS
ncbi:hypothetical protein NM208_g9360 [Fusarium decemcellulare]|uniref:Uncharacterized protein n=1 Tax=Fusarium decemcellulare TaxID=57161 RepID=A0ACC1S263_9HYPO|nr:hypothetical protein NM208_g9360 [Fusarium decemcellulare]